MFTVVPLWIGHLGTKPECECSVPAEKLTKDALPACSRFHARPFNCYIQLSQFSLKESLNLLRRWRARQRTGINVNIYPEVAFDSVYMIEKFLLGVAC